MAKVPNIEKNMHYKFFRMLEETEVIDRQSCCIRKEVLKKQIKL